MVNWTETMVKGLMARKAYGGKGGGVARVRKSKPKESMHEQARREEREDVQLEKTRADIARTKAETVELQEAGEASRKKIDALVKNLDPKPMTEMEKALLKKQKLQNISSGLKNATSFLPQVTKDTYDDWHRWVQESDFVPYNTFRSPGEVANMTPVEFNVYKSKLTGMGALDSKSLDRLSREKIAENKARDLKAAKDADRELTDLSYKTRSAQELIKELNKKYIGQDVDDMSPGDAKAYTAAMDIIGGRLGVEPPTEQIEDDTRLAHRKVIDEAMAAQAESMIPADVLEAYRERYPDRTDAEITQAYIRAQQ